MVGVPHGLGTRCGDPGPRAVRSEGVPGHHLQGAMALENQELPSFLRYLEDYTPTLKSRSNATRAPVVIYF